MAYVHHTTDTFKKVLNVSLTRGEIVEAFKNAVGADYREGEWAQMGETPCAVKISVGDRVVSFDSVAVGGEVDAVYISPEGVKEYCENIVEKFLAIVSPKWSEPFWAHEVEWEETIEADFPRPVTSSGRLCPDTYYFIKVYGVGAPFDEVVSAEVEQFPSEPVQEIVDRIFDANQLGVEVCLFGWPMLEEKRTINIPKKMPSLETWKKCGVPRISG